MTPGRQHALGDDGERVSRQLLGALELERRLAVFLLESPHATLFAELRVRLEAAGARITRIPAVPDVVEAVHEAARQAAGVERLPVAWLDLPSDPNTAAACLVALNAGRDHLDAAGPVFLVVSASRGAPWHVAPDLTSIASGPYLLDEAPVPLADAQGPVGFVHISDFHIKSPTKWQSDTVLGALRRDLPRLLGEASIPPHLLFATGDFAFSGKPEEFEEAQRFLGDLLDALRPLLPEDEGARWPRLFVVPGNHDVDRTRIGRMAPRDKAQLLAQRDPEGFRDEAGEMWGDAETFESFHRRLGAFYEFSRKLLGDARQLQPHLGARLDLERVRGIELAVLQLNSAWTCDADDKEGRVVVAERQLRALTHELEGLRQTSAQVAQLVVALIHHPAEWWPEPERRALLELMRRHSDLILHGHVHETDASGWLQQHRKVLTLGAGAAYAGAGWHHGVSAGLIDPESETLALHAFRYSDRGGGFWHRDTTIAQDAPDGVFTFPLPRPIAVASAEKDTASGAEVVVGREALVHRLARLAESVYGAVDFIGMPDHTRRPKVRVKALFVPLEFEERRRREDNGKVTTDDLYRALVDPTLDDHARTFQHEAATVILGDPGSGKSTLVKYLAHRAATDETPRVPILVVLREYVRQGRNDGLLAFAADEMSVHLATPVSADQLVALAEGGDALLLVDGFDEVASEDQRTRVRDMVAGLARRFRRLPIVATSRIVGYDRAPLPDTFRELRIAPFEADAIERFVDRWYDLAMPDEPRERDRRRAALKAALDAEPRAKELARNPLFATLIALVQFHEANLPGERAKLYELLVRMLLETRPASTNRVFRDERLDVGRQRTILEALAFDIQSRREEGLGGASVSIGRDALEGFVTQRISDLLGVSVVEAGVLARRWLAYLEAGTGLLVESQPGIYAFLHLSVLEYLAACAASREWGHAGLEGLAHEIVARASDSRWVETLLLLLGSRSADRQLGDRVVAEVSTTDPGFGLRVLREEVDVSPEVVKDLLERAVAAVPEDLYFARSWRRTAGEILAFSQRHGRALSEHLTRGLERGEVDSLLGRIVLGPEPLLPSILSHPRFHARKESLVSGASLALLLAPGFNLAPEVRAAASPRDRVASLALSRLSDFRDFAWLGSDRGSAALATVIATGSGSETSATPHGYLTCGEYVVPALRRLLSHARHGVIGYPSEVRVDSSLRLNLWSFGDEPAAALARAFERSLLLAPIFGDEVVPQTDPEGVLVLQSWLWFLTSEVAESVLPSSRATLARGQATPKQRRIVEDLRRTLPVVAWRTIHQSHPATPLAAASLRVLAALATEEDYSPAEPLVARAAFTVVAGVLCSRHLGDSRISALEANARAKALWTNWFCDSIADYLGTSLPDSRAFLGALAIQSFNLLWLWPEGDWFRAWYEGDEPEHWNERFVWNFAHGLEAYGDGDWLARADAALDGADTDDTRDLAAFFRELEVRPRTWDELLEEERQSRERYEQWRAGEGSS